MHIKKLTLSLFIMAATLILLTACKAPFSSSIATADADVSMGRYIESDWDLSSILNNGTITALFMDAKNRPSLYIDGDNGIEGYTFDQDHKFTKQNLPWADSFNHYPYDIGTIIPDSSGNLYFTGEINMGELFIAKLEENKLKEIPIDWEVPALYIRDIAVSDNNTLFILDNNETIRQYDGTTGKYINKYTNQSFTHFQLYKDSIIGLPAPASDLEIIDTSTMSLSRSIPLPSQAENANIHVDPQSGDIYFINKAGIWHITQSGTVWEQIVDGSLCSLSSVSIQVSHFLVFDNEFYLEYWGPNPGSYSYKKLSYSSTTPTHPDKEITVYSLYDDVATNSYYTKLTINNTIKEALNAYQTAHPDVYFKFIVGVNDSTTESQAIQSLNTELLSHKGPDIILLDRLPAATYAQKGLFADLSDCINPLIESGDILPGISTAYSYNDTTYALPLRFTFTTIWGKSDILNKSHSLHDLALYKKAHPEEPLYQYEEPDFLIKLFYPICSSTWIDENKNLNKEDIKTFLEDIKTLALDGEDYDTRYSHWLTMNAMALLYGQSQIQAIIDDNIDLLTASAYANDMLDSYTYKLFPDNSSSTFRSSNLFAINSGSKYQDIAKDILKTALTEDIQSLNLHDGFPINKSALKRWFAGELFKQSPHPDTTYVIYGTSSATEKSTYYNWADYTDVLQDIYSNCEKLAIPTNEDSQTLELILTNSKPYFNGNATLDEVTDHIYEKLILSLDE